MVEQLLEFDESKTQSTEEVAAEESKKVEWGFKKSYSRDIWPSNWCRDCWLGKELFFVLYF